MTSDTASVNQALRSLADLLQTSSTARVYLRASGGLLRLAKATAAECIGFVEYRDSVNSTAKLPRENYNQAQEEAESIHRDGCTKSSSQHDPEGVRLMLAAIAAALEGGERLAQQDLLRSGLLTEPCARVLWTDMDAAIAGTQGKTNYVRTNESIAGVATHVVRQAVEDLGVRVQVARCNPLLAGLVAVISSALTSPAATLDAEAAASTLARVLLGRTASNATKTLRKITAPSQTTFGADNEREKLLTGSQYLTLVASKGLLAWKERRGCMQVAGAFSRGQIVPFNLRSLFIRFITLFVLWH